MSSRRSLPRWTWPLSTWPLATVSTASACALLLAACAAPHARHELPTPVAGDGVSGAPAAGERMPSAPQDERAWLAAVDTAYAGVGAGTAEDWLRRRMSVRRSGERLAVVLGIDDVMVRTHFGDTGALVPRSVRFVRTAHALGYSVFYVTGRSGAGLQQVERTLVRAHVPANVFYGRPLDAPDEESAKAECRAAIISQGYTIAMVVAASEASFDGAPHPEEEIRLPDFGVPD